MYQKYVITYKMNFVVQNKQKHPVLLLTFISHASQLMCSSAGHVLQQHTPELNFGQQTHSTEV